jgi:1-aminocyclopropane-1-carboxylate deaminase/D-cysteine desulfhydrase-like pyridoxal-dependent ACC family enzyme
MLSIACLCRAKGWIFHYYTKTLPSYLKGNLEGNLAQAIALGMIVHEVSHENYEDKVIELRSLNEEKTLVISQGGADKIASLGIEVLAQEINFWKSKSNLEKLIVVLPSGTGSTALYLKAFLDKDIELYTVVLVGDEAFQLEQWKRLSTGPYPKILSSPKKKFAKPYTEYLQMYTELKSELKIEFDLIYAPKTWIQISEQLLDEESEILYIHTGGVSGNQSMLERYAYKGRR